MKVKANFFWLPTKLAVIAFMLAVSGVYIVSNAINVFFMVPDTFSVYRNYLNEGALGGVYSYWVHFMGRISSMALAFFEIMLIDTFAHSLWQGLVFFKVLNHLSIMAAFYIGFRMFAPGTSRLLVVALSVFAYAVSNSLWGGNSFPSTSGILTLWLVDQSIYLFSAATYLIMFACLWRYLNQDFTRGQVLGFFLVFFLFLNTHELNLAVGGMVLAIVVTGNSVPPLLRHMAASHWGGLYLCGDHKSRPHRNDNRGHLYDIWWRGWANGFRHFFSIRERPLTTSAGLTFIYITSAAIQLLSPSLSFRENVWPVAMPLFPDSFLAGLNTGWSTFDRFFEFSLPVLPAVFLACLAAGLTSSQRRNVRARRRAIFFIGLALFFLACFSFIMSTLMIYSSRLTEASRIFAPHQHIYTSILGAYTVGLIGLLLGGSIIDFPALRKNLKHATWGFLAVVTLFMIMPSPAFQDTYAFLRGERQFDVPGSGGWLQADAFSRFDEQLRHPDTDGKAYVDELFVHTGSPDNPAFRKYFESNDIGLARIYSLSDIIYLPCELGPKPIVCNGKGLPPRQEEIKFEWGNSKGSDRYKPVNITTIFESGLKISETPDYGEHYLNVGPIGKGEQVAIRAEVEILDPKDVNGFALNMISADGAAIQYFDLKNMKASVGDESGGQIIQPKVMVRDDGVVVLSAIFVVFGSSPTFDFRLQMVDDVLTTRYTGQSNRGVVIGRLTLSLVHS